MIRAEALRFASELRFYLLAHIGQFISRVIVLGGLLWITLRQGQQSLSTLVALFFWQYATLPLSRLSADLWEDSYSGAFEQTYINARAYWAVLTVRTGFYFAYQTVTGLLLVLSFAVLFGYEPGALVAYPWGTTLGLLALVFLTLWGLGLGAAALLVVYRKGIAFADLVEYLLLFVAGIIVPLHELPRYVQAVSPFLPLTLAVDLLRTAEAGALTLADPRLYWLAVQSLVYAAGGWWAFQRASHAARRGRGFFNG